MLVHVLGLLFCISAPDDMSELNLGETVLRRTWHETKGDAKSIDQFKAEHFLIDLAELKWAELLKGDKVEFEKYQSTHDIRLTGYLIETAIAQQPWNIQAWMTLLVSYFKNIFERPFDATREIHIFFDRITIPLMLSLILVLIFHIWNWANPIIKDLPRFLGSRSPLLLLSILGTSLTWTLIAGLWIPFLLALLAISIIYSHSKKLYLICGVIIASTLTLLPFLQDMYQVARKLDAHEALDHGRTRLEYSPASLEILAPFEKSLWADYNGDLTAASYWLEQAPLSKEKAILSTNLTSGQTLPLDLISYYESLRSTYGDDSTILFNLSQLYTRTQQLLKADQIRAQINPEFFSDASRQTSITGRLLIPPAPQKRAAIYFENLKVKIRETLSTLGFYPFVVKEALLSLLQILAPWILIIFASATRASASGLCTQTGEPTRSTDVTSSQLYQTIMQKKEGVHPSLRQQLDLLTRRRHNDQNNQVRLFSFFLPGSSALILDDNSALSWFQNFLVLFFAWNALPHSARLFLTEKMGFNPELTWGAPGISLGFLILFLVCYLFLIFKNLARVNV